MKYVEETNLKHGLNLKFTRLEAPEVDLWAKYISGSRSQRGPAAA